MVATPEGNLLGTGTGRLAVAVGTAVGISQLSQVCAVKVTPGNVKLCALGIAICLMTLKTL